MRRGAAEPDQGDLAAVGADPSGLVLAIGVVGQDRDLTGRDVEGGGDAALVATGLGQHPADDDGAAVGADVPRRLVVHAAGHVAGEVGEPQRRVGLRGQRRHVGGRGGEQPGGRRPEVVVPVPHRVAIVQDRRDLRLPALLRGLGVVAVVGACQGRRAEQQGAGLAGHDEPADAAGPTCHQPRLTPGPRQQPQRRRLRVVLLVTGDAAGSARREQQVALAGEGGARLALRAAGQPASGFPAPWVELPQRRDVAGPLGVQGLHGRDEAGAVGRQGQPDQPRLLDEGGEVVERRARFGGRRFGGRRLGGRRLGGRGGLIGRDLVEGVRLIGRDDHVPLLPGATPTWRPSSGGWPDGSGRRRPPSPWRTRSW